ncbi:DMT family transporter [Pantanalinema rosaneae CENA516]|uniref:DMT family transporter n=1 Tax=Pantanalinema rosaneae TaxID=1620701 RepID=UPI003D6DF09C
MSQPTSKAPSHWQIGLVLMIGILAASTAAILIRLAIAAAAIQGVGFSLVLAASRLTIASIVLLPTWRSIQRRPPAIAAYQAAAAAGLALAIHFATWITSLSYTSIAASTTLVTTNPIWVALFSWIWWRELPSRLTLAGIAIALSGGILISLGSESSTVISSQPWLGNGLALMGAWAASAYFLFGREAQRQGMGIGGYATVAYTVAAIVLLPLPLLMGTSYRGYPTLTYGYMVLMALLPQLVGHTSFNWAVRWVSPTLVTLVILFEPVISSILGYWLFREVPGVTVLAGAGVMLLGVALAAVNR